jgi:hypothetical protein
MALHEIGWRNDKLLDILHSYVMKMRAKLNVYYIALILNAYAALCPDNGRYLSELGPELHDRLVKGVNTETFRVDPVKGPPPTNAVEELIPDLTTYANLWLAITCFGVKSTVEGVPDQQDDIGRVGEFGTNSVGIIRALARDLIKVFNGNKRWRATDLNVHEATTVSIAIASLKLSGQGPIERFAADIGDIIRANIKEASNEDLINLSKSTFYLRKFEHTRDLYSHVHAECVTRFNLRQLHDEDKEHLGRIYQSHGIMTESPFATVRVTR